MRLDHLLSKEQLSRESGTGAPLSPIVWGGVLLIGGDTGESCPATAGFSSTALTFGLGCGVVSVGVFGTLLGPEATPVLWVVVS